MAVRLNLRAELAIGRNSMDCGRVCRLVDWVAASPRRLPSVVELLWDDDPGVASRAADVLERVTRSKAPPGMGRMMQEYKSELIGLIADATLPKVRWNLALTLPRLTLTVPDCRRIAAVLDSWRDDKSSIVKTAALHGTAQLTRQDPESLPEVLDLLRVAGRSGTPAMRARSRHLLSEFENPGKKRSTAAPAYLSSRTSL